MTAAFRIVNYLLENEELDDFGDDWKDVTTDLPLLLDEAGFTRQGQFTWNYKINKWMTATVQLRTDRWHGRIQFEQVVLNEFEGTSVEMARWLESSGNWPKGHFSDWNRFRAAAQRKTIRESDEGDDWKDVTPSIPAANIERWVFTDYELKNFRVLSKCSGLDEFLADGGAELAVIVLRNGTTTNRWEDGTVGVPPRVADLADFDELPIKPKHKRAFDDFGDEDTAAENWRDVYVDKNGKFLGFAEPRHRLPESTENDENDDWKDVTWTTTIESILARNGFVVQRGETNKWVRIDAEFRGYRPIKETIWNDGQWNYKAQVKKRPRWWSTYCKQKFDTEDDLLWHLRTYRIADIGNSALEESSDEEDFRDITRTDPFADITDQFLKGGWTEVASAGPEQYRRNRYDGENLVKWQIISWSYEDHAWRLVDTGKGVIEGPMEEILPIADELWTQQ